MLHQHKVRIEAASSIEAAACPREQSPHPNSRNSRLLASVRHGENQGDTLNSACVYDPQADAWTQLPSMSIARDSHASAAVGGKLYVFGGRDARQPLRTTEVYDPASGSWAQGLSLTSARGSLAAIAL